MTTPLDAVDRSPYFSDGVALQFYKDYNISSKEIIWAGRPVLRGGYWRRTGLFWLFASLTILTTIYLPTQAQLSTFGWVVVIIVSCLVC